ncbi:UDP-glucose--hexose-1-phosphate uridylyltransferase [Clostridium sp. 19966]|uniref:UDP-glucose--hexose-1-phosphate uridylyltransferase n=1 Tax=Clostridium sp. 19966 TaxID=2768166 RepID=UPI0028E05BF7|nr:UDP-glucose--hexose-1-phosphate uridylyltransferase [Clostridium sp. 19966]MDT8715640.1 UDP-glucose--hexose-1-phosphate uridylyltransferase [Clostridium sp. 19966]
MGQIQCAMDIERLLAFALQHEMIEELDVIPTRNALMDLLKISEPYEGKLASEKFDVPTEILNSILDYCAETGILEIDTVNYRDLLDAKIMGLFMPRESEVVNKFYELAKKEGIEKATDKFYALSQASNYIRMDRIKKNLYWLADTEYGDIEITVNLSKPEKDPKDIAAAKLLPQSQYPKCLLCIENVGYAGRVNHPARQNHRVIPVELKGEQWYFQYSPYVYYNEHCIVFKKEHEPMKISENTFNRLTEFVEKFPHYFIGSNADLPIVGGSILTHEHFQGGKHIFPMEVAKEEVKFTNRKYETVKAAIVKWPLSVIRLNSNNKKEIISLSNEILSAWREYSDKTADIFAYTYEEEKAVPHNTITPIARINAQGEYEMDLVLRNNRTSEAYPDGIFHPHKELHHIKKENIGLIEVMGLAVLPARLQQELASIADIITGDENLDSVSEESDLFKHKTWMEELINKYGNKIDKMEVENILKQEVGNKFLQVLLDAGVYKKNEKGLEAFTNFMKSVGFDLEK